MKIGVIGIGNIGGSSRLPATRCGSRIPAERTR